MKKLFGIVLLIIFALRSYLSSGISGNLAASIGEFIPVALVGILGLYLTFSKK